jgi:hypothetical protein
MEEKFKESFKQASAFQKMWMDSMAGMTRVWSDYSPNNPPPDELKKIRNGVLKSISQTWEEYMRTPEFMKAMRDTMNNSVQWQKMAKENTNKMHTALGSATKDDVQGIMVALQHVERRVLDGLDEMKARVASMQKDLDGIQTESGKALEKYQLQILKQLAEVEKAMKATKPAAAPVAAKPAPAAALKPAPATVKPAPANVASAKKVVVKKSVAKKSPAKKKPANKTAVKKVAKKTVQSKTSKAK